MALAAVFAVSCLLGVRSRPVEPPTGEFCPPRWAAEDDPDRPQIEDAPVSVEADLPEGARPLLPGRAARLAPGCPLELPLHIERDKCYLFAFQIIPRDGRPRAKVRYPDPSMAELRDFDLVHGMVETHGQGADPLCYRDSFDSVVEVSVSGRGDLMWVQAYEITPRAAREWSALRRSRLAQMHAQPEEPESPPPHGGLPDGGLPDGGLPDGGSSGGASPAEGSPDGGAMPDAGPPDGGAVDGGPARECEVVDAAFDGDIPDGGLPDGGLCRPVPPPPPPEPPPPPPIPEGPLAVELPDQCQDGRDNDEDGWPDCDDPDCAGLCRQHRTERVPWLRTVDLRVGGHYRINADSLDPNETFATDFFPLEARGGGSGQVAAVWRPHRYLGLGLDLNVGAFRLNSRNSMGTYRQLRVSLLTASLGLSFQVSIPVWIMEIGGSVGIGWIYWRADTEWRPLEGPDTEWRDHEDYDGLSASNGYGSGTIWVDFWLADSIAVGVYGGVLAAMDAEKGLPTNDYHVGLRSTLRLGL